MYWDTIKEGLVELAFIDEADSYEVDQCLIGFDKATGKFALITATGCSCWDGEADREDFNSLEELESSLINSDRTYSPSINGAKSLILEAKKTYEREKATLQRNG
jgi:hypothetical protein